jgi:hypothetical protein
VQINREDVVQAALTVERWCREHERGKYEDCVDCPFLYETEGLALLCKLFPRKIPKQWKLEKYLRERGLKRGQK